MKIVFAKTSPEKVKKQREFFDKKVKAKFIKWCYYKGFFDGVFNKQEMELARDGKLPLYVNIHHLIPLSAEGDDRLNNFYNLCITTKDKHTRIHNEYIREQMKGFEKLKEGLTMIVDIPVISPVDREEILRHKRFLNHNKHFMNSK